MTTNYPTSIDSFSGTRGTNGQPLNAPNHVTHHTNEDDAITALETKVGVDGSAVTSTVDYKLSEVLTATPDKAVGKVATQTLTNKTLTSPKITAGSMSKGDMLQLSASDGTLTTVRATNNADIISWNSSSQQWEPIANPAASDASTTVKGVVEEATLAETLARTAAGGTSARLFVNPTTLTTVQTYDYVVDTGSSTAYAIAPTPAITAYVAGQTFRFKAVNANTSTTPTLAVSGLTAKTIVKNGATALAVGDIAANSIVEVMYNSSGNMELQTPSANTFLGLFKNGTTTKNSADASATQTIAHGLGVTPKNVRLIAYGSAASASTNLNWATDVYNGTTESSFSLAGSGNNTLVQTGFIITEEATNPGSNKTTGTVTFDATNISIAWTKTGSPTGTYTILWEAEA